MAELEGKDDRLDDTYYKPNPFQVPAKNRDNAIQTCYEVARDRGLQYFAVNNNGWCAGSTSAEIRYKAYGKVKTCKDGKGGQWSNDVYFIVHRLGMSFPYFLFSVKISRFWTRILIEQLIYIKSRSLQNLKNNF